MKEDRLLSINQLTDLIQMYNRFISEYVYVGLSILSFNMSEDMYVFQNRIRFILKKKKYVLYFGY